MKKILITGGAGFIGTHLIERLKNNYHIIIFDNLRRNSLQYMPELKNNQNIEFIQGNVLDKDSLREAMKGCEMVVHMAAIAGVSSYYIEPGTTLTVNLIGTYNVLELCKELLVKKIIDISTSEVYGVFAYNVKEASPHQIGPVNDLRWTYAVSKLASEQLTLRYSEQFKFKAFTVRPFNIYGPRQTGEGAISNFLKAIINNEPISIYGDGNVIRAWCYVSDLIDALENIICLDNLKSDTFNIGNPTEAYTTLGLARLICEVTGKKVPFKFKKVARTEIQVRTPNIDYAQNVLKYNPKIDLKKGIELTYNYYKKVEMK
jgi:UDP-glucuronate decarboxylase